MALIVLDGDTVSVADSDGAKSLEMVGEEGRGFDGEFHRSRRSEKRDFAFRSTPLAESDADALILTLSGPAVTASGDFCSPDTSISVLGQLGTVETVQTADGFRLVVSFSLLEV